MKTNLPSTLTSQKISIFFLMILLKTSEVSAGQGYKDCIDHFNLSYGSGSPYQALLQYSFDSNSVINSGGSLKLCCNKSSCSNNLIGCPSGSIFGCQKIGKSVYCVDAGHSTTCAGGVIGDKLITERATGRGCTKSLDESNLSVPWNKGSSIYEVSCYSSGYYERLSCAWDNGGWTCADSTDSSCYYQWPAQYPGRTCSISSSSSDNSKKIAIGVGTGVGVPVIGVASYVVWKKNAAKKKQIEDRVDQVEIEISELENKNKGNSNSNDNNSNDTNSSTSSSSDEEKDVRNILIIGSQGSGKSALANTITGTNKFDENTSSKSYSIKTGEFKHQWVKYRIIDTTAIDGDLLDKDGVLHKVIKAIYSIKGGLNQIFFVSGSHLFSEKDISTYNMLSEAFGEKVTKYTTIVRTKFSEFENQVKCEEDKVKLSKQNKELAKIIEECNGIIHVDNPSVDVANSKEIRNSSKEKLLKYLTNENCQEIYKHKIHKLRKLVKGIDKLGNLQGQQYQAQIELPNPTNK